MLRSTLLALGLWLLPAAAPAFAEQAHDAHDGDAAEEDGSAHGGHGGALTVDEILHGEERFSFYAALLNFALLILVLRKLGARPLSLFLNKRRSDLEQGIKEAGEAKAKAEAKYREYAERLEKLDDELKKLRGDIEQASRGERERILAEAKAGSARVDNETRALIELQAKQLTADVRRDMVAAAVEGAEKVLREKLGADDQKRLADGFVSDLRSLNQEKRA